MPMYQLSGAVQRAEELDQGDVLADVFLPVAPTDTAVHVRRKGAVEPAKPADFSTPEELRVLVKLKRHTFALVLSPSCDIAVGYPIELAPVAPLELKEHTEADRWRRISQLGTGGGTPRQFYLPADPGIGLVRSQAKLDARVFVDTTFVGRLFRETTAKRVGALTPEAVRHLQWALSFSYTRNARADLEWPSYEDLLLKRAYLRDEIEKGGRRRAEDEADLKDLEAHLTRAGVALP